MAKTPAKKIFLLLIAYLFLLSGAGIGRAEALTGDNLKKAVNAAQSPSPTPEENRALAMVTTTLTPAVFQKLGINPVTASRDDVEELREVSRLALKVLGVMTENDPAVLSKVTLDDLVPISLAVMTQIKELKVTDNNLKDEKYLQETFIPAVIETLAKPR